MAAWAQCPESMHECRMETLCDLRCWQLTSYSQCLCRRFSECTSVWWQRPAASCTPHRSTSWNSKRTCCWSIKEAGTPAAQAASTRRPYPRPAPLSRLSRNDTRPAVWSGGKTVRDQLRTESTSDTTSRSHTWATLPILLLVVYVISRERGGCQPEPEVYEPGVGYPPESASECNLWPYWVCVTSCVRFANCSFEPTLWNDSVSS